MDIINQIEGWFHVVSKTNPAKSIVSFECIEDAITWVSAKNYPHLYEIVEYDFLMKRKGMPGIPISKRIRKSAEEIPIFVDRESGMFLINEILKRNIR